MSPVALLIRTALFPAWIAKNRSKRLTYMKALERSQYLSADALRDLQWTQFKAMLDHAYAQCPFYRYKYAAAGVHPGDITTPAHVAALPSLSKEEIQESLDGLIAHNARGRPLRRDMTGGSTGSPMVFYYDEDRLDSRAAATLRHNKWTGWNIGDKIALLWGAPRDVAAPPSTKDRLRDWILDRRVIMDASTISGWSASAGSWSSSGRSSCSPTPTPWRCSRASCATRAAARSNPGPSSARARC
jgi:phenylacetate-CoA ligase